MLRLSGVVRCSAAASRPRRICYVTDVEGDMAYFQRFVHLSRCLQWERAVKNSSSCSSGSGSTAYAPLHVGSSSSSSSCIGVDHHVAAPSMNCRTRSVTPSPAQQQQQQQQQQQHIITKLDIEDGGVRLAFTDAHTHLVFGGDAFDHGPDLSFGTALLDLKRRHPDRVHLILGNRDLNKMVLAPLMHEVVGLSPSDAERHIFPPRRLSGGAAAGAAPPLPSAVSYEDYLRAAGLPTTRTDRVSFLKWALKNKMGSPNGFEHRRRELLALQRQRAHQQVGAGATLGDIGGDGVDDEAVAESYFAAARPGGVYYEYMRAGVLMLPLGGVLFVHGGVNADNVGFVPDIAASDYTTQTARGRWLVEEGVDCLAWARALNDFKEESFREWTTCTGTRGEAIRHYVLPRDLVPYSATVGSFVGQRGPQTVTLPVIQYLLECGLHTVCGGHQPSGDTPAIVRQPGGFLMIDADNSYSGRGNPFSTPLNQRGLAVQEVIFNNTPSQEGEEGEEGEDWLNAGSVVVHGQQSDGRPFAFSLDDHPLVGCHVGDDWWVKLPLYSLPGPRDDAAAAAGNAAADGGAAGLPETAHAGGVRPVQPSSWAAAAPMHELHRTRDGYRHEEVSLRLTAEVEEMLQAYRRHQHVPLPGELRPRFTKEELAQVHVHRVKTKVKPKKKTGEKWEAQYE